MRIIAITIALIVLTTTASNAQQKTLQSGMQHIIVTKPQTPETPEKPNIAAVTPQTTTTSKPAEKTKTEAEIKAEADKSADIWKKYKELAAGTAPAEEPDPPSTADVAAKTEITKSQNNEPTGIAGIIADYRKNKKQQSEMKTLRFDPPATNNISK
jgi:outer membrane biosynthesis protein TonB